MSNQSVFCIAGSLTQADQIVDRLREAGFSNNDVSVLFPDKSTTREFAHEKNTKAPEGAAAGASAGGVLGGALGWLIGIGMLAVPGVGPFIAAGPIMAALGGVGVGAALGGITGALIGLGVPEFEARRYEGRIRDGGILISVHAEDSDAVARAREIFEDADAKDIATAGEVDPGEVRREPSTPSPNEASRRADYYVR